MYSSNFSRRVRLYWVEEEWRMKLGCRLDLNIHYPLKTSGLCYVAVECSVEGFEQWCDMIRAIFYGFMNMYLDVD